MRESQADIMVRLALSLDIRLFTDQYDNPHIRFPNNDIYKTYPLKTGAVKQWLSKLLWDTMGKAPGGEASNSALNVLKAMAREESNIPLYNRVAPGVMGDIWIDVADPQWRAIHVTREGWKMVNAPPVLFRRFSHQKALPEPVRGGSFEDILQFANLKDKNHQLLYAVTTVSCFIPDIPHVVLVCHGPHGSGKSMAMLAQRAVVDPSILKLLNMPRVEKELVQQLYHHYCGSYDNISTLKKWASDVFCRASTGTGVSKRGLYTDDDDVIYQYRRCCSLNGINVTAESGDLLDRSVLLEFTLLDETSRIEDKELDQMLEERGGGLLGGALDVLVKAMNIHPSVELKGLFRMADFTRWGYAISEVLGYGGEAFMEAYRENIKTQSFETIKVSVLAEVLLRFMEDQIGGEWHGTPTDLYMRLKAKADDLSISTRQKAWPKNPHWMGRRLNELSPCLPTAGYFYESSHTGKDRLISIYKAGRTPTNAVNVVNVVKEPNEINETNTILQSFSRYDCAFCGGTLNADTGDFMDPETGNHYCRQHWVARKRIIGGELR